MGSEMCIRDSIYTLNQAFGVESIVDPNGNTLTYTDNGIFHSSGKSVTFSRNANGTIETITDPSGAEIRYLQNSNQDLVAVTERDGAETSFTYNRNHGLVDIIDPLGRKVVKNLYDDQGRLFAQEDGEGNVKTFDHDLEANSSVVTDRDGRITTFIYDARGNVENETMVIDDGTYVSDIVTAYTYDANDNQETRSIGESTWASEFDERNNQLFATDPENNTVYYRDYNQRG